MERIYHHFNKWEDFHHGMYDEDKDGRQERVKTAANILGTPQICKVAMKRVIDEWAVATEQNLSNVEINRRAWLGQAACSIYGNIHEDETREAWGLLTVEQRTTANAIATQIINKWLYERDKALEPQLSLFD